MITLNRRAVLLATAGMSVAFVADAFADASVATGDLVSAGSFAAPAPIQSDSKLLIYWMKGFSGAMVRASALLFIPQGATPAGGWPLVAWVHGTTTVGSGPATAVSCAPSLSPNLYVASTAELATIGDPNITLNFIAGLVSAGFAVVAPDLEGLGAVAERDGTPYPYYNISSSGRSVAGAVVAAHQTGTPLTKSWMSVGHSEGGHIVMALETTAADASAYDYRGTAAIAPFNFIAASVSAIGAAAVADPENLAGYRTVQNSYVAMFSAALARQQPNFSPDQVMGSDLLALIPSYEGKCVIKAMGDLGQSIATQKPEQFRGYLPNWADNPAMKAFFQTNDLAVVPGFTVKKPTLVLQGGIDGFVLISLQSDFVGRLQAAGMPVTYVTYPKADHITVLPQGTSEILKFLKANLS